MRTDPFGPRGSPVSWMVPRYWHSATVAPSPSKIQRSKVFWSSLVVASWYSLRTGRGELRSMTRFTRPPPPGSPTPMEMGTTSMSTTPSALFSEWARRAAPTATASSGCTALLGAFPKNDRIRSWTSGMRDCPPTRITSSTSPGSSPLSSRTRAQVCTVRSTSGATSRSRSARVSVVSSAAGTPLTVAR